MEKNFEKLMKIVSGGGYYLYNTNKLKLTGVLEKNETLVVYTDSGKQINLQKDDVNKFIAQLLPIENEVSLQQNKTVSKMDEMFFNLASGLKSDFDKLEEDKDYIQQAKQRADTVKTMLDMTKTQLDFLKFTNK